VNSYGSGSTGCWSPNSDMTMTHVQRLSGFDGRHAAMSPASHTVFLLHAARTLNSLKKTLITPKKDISL
jgi:hypothetical protein